MMCSIIMSKQKTQLTQRAEDYWYYERRSSMPHVIYLTISLPK